jgi:hypothetical protein
VSFVNPLAAPGAIFVADVGEAEGARGAAAALACVEADSDGAGLFVDVGGRAPRPTLLASAAAQALEKRIAAHLPDVRVAARGQVCHLAVLPEPEGFGVAAAAVAVARGLPAVLHVPPQLLQPLLDDRAAPGASGVLLRADLGRDRALVGLVVRGLLDRGLAVGVLKRRLPWVTERRALFGVLPAGGSAGLPERLVRRLVPSSRDRAAIPALAREAAGWTG